MTKYPSELDTDTELPAVQDSISEYSGDTINRLRASVFAMQAAIGTSPQGSSSTLSARLAQALNDDGTLKAAALVASGLIALPITNDQIGSSAAIEESKLDLDVRTGVLQNQIDSSRVDILAIQESLAQDIVNLSEHVLGQDDRHDGYMIDLAGLTGHAEITTVGAALAFIWDTFLGHKSASVAAEHLASAISYVPLAGGAIPDTNVQDALETVDEGFTEQRRIHNDTAHTDGVSNDGYFALSGQTGTNDGCLKLTRYQTAAGAKDIIKLGHPNAASIKTKGIRPTAITATTSEFNIVVGVGSGLEKTLSITSLHTARYPTANTILTLDGIVDYINEKAAALADHFPVSAFASPDGELVLQHNIDRDDCTIKVTAGGQSAIAALGLSSVVGTKFSRISSHQFVVDGNPFSELKTIVSGEVTLGALSSLIDIGEDVNELGLFANSLIHIFNHSTAAANGTYRIAQISPASPSPSTTVGLATTVAAGTFDFVIYADSFELDFSGSPRVVDLLLDSERNPVAEERAAVTFGGLGGVKVVELSPDFPEFSSGSITMATVSGFRSVSISNGSVSGLASTFVEGAFFGHLKVYAPDNKGFATLFVTDASPTNGTDSLATFEPDLREDKMLLGTAHFNANTVVEIPVDKRNVGLIGTSAVGSQFKTEVLERDSNYLHGNGCIRGFATTVSGTTSIIIDGGQAYVDGRLISKPRETLLVTGVATTAGDYFLALNKNGLYEIHSESAITASYLLSLTDKLVLAKITVTAGPVVSSVADARFFINNLGNKVPIRIEDADLGSGTFRTLTAAEFYATNLSDTKTRVEIFANLTETTVSVTENHEVIVHGNLTITGNLTLQSLSRVLVFGSLTVGGDTILQTASRLICYSPCTFVDIDVGANATIELHDDVVAKQVVMSGNGSSLIGSDNDAAGISFTGTAHGVIVDADEVSIVGVNLLMPNVAFTAMRVGSLATVVDLLVANCYLAQNFAVTESGWSTEARSGIKLVAGITLRNSKIIGCTFFNFAEAISGNDAAGTVTSMDNVLIESCIIDSCGTGIYLESSENCRIINNTIVTIRDSHIRFHESGTQTHNIIANNVFETQSATAGSSLIAILLGTNCDYVVIRDNLFRNFNGASAIKVESSSGNPTGHVVSGNFFSAISTTNNYLLDFSNSRGGGLITGNFTSNISGNLLTATDCVVADNFFSSNHTSSTVAPLKITNNLAYPVFTGNNVSVSSNRAIHFSGSAIIADNYISSGAVLIDALNDNDGMMLENNFMNLTGTVNTTTSLAIDTGADFAARHTIRGNIVKCGESGGTGVSVSAGLFVISDNIITGISGSVPSILLNLTGNSSGHHLVNGNHIQAGTGANYAVFIDGDKVSLTNNYIDCVATATAGVSFSSGSDNICVLNNFMAGSSNGLLITHPSGANPTNLHIGYNKNYTDSFVQNSLAAAEVSGSWSVGSDKNLTSSSGAGELVLDLTGLPLGSQIVSVSLSVLCNGIGIVSGQIFKRESGGMPVISSGSASSNTTTAYETITVTPSTEYVKRNSDYILRIVKASGTVEIGQISVNIKY